MSRSLKAYRLFCPHIFGEYCSWRLAGIVIKTLDGWQYECQGRGFRPIQTQYAGGGSYALIGFFVEKEFVWLIDQTRDHEGKLVYRHIGLDKFLRTAFVEEEGGVKGLYSSYSHWELGKPENYKFSKRRWLPRVQVYGHYAEALLPHLLEREYFIKGLTPERTWNVSQPV